MPNQSEDQILIKYFKYFDLENSGKACLRDFIKAVEKIGLVLMKVNEIQDVFNYYDTDRSGFIDYKKFSYQLFNRKLESRGNNTNTQAGLRKNKDQNDFNK